MSRDKDLDKSRIEVLRDALKDVSDTIRAQDRKISYIIAIVLFIFSGYFINLPNFLGVQNISNIEFIDYFPLSYLTLSIVFFFYAYNPVSNPVEVLKKDDVDFGRDKFFSLYEFDKNKNAKSLADNYIDSTEDIKGVARVLYVEILKLSKIRERKIKLIKVANKLFFLGILLMVLQLVIQNQNLIVYTIFYEIIRYFYNILNINKKYPFNSLLGY